MKQTRIIRFAFDFKAGDGHNIETMDSGTSASIRLTFQATYDKII